MAPFTKTSVLVDSRPLELMASGTIPSPNKVVLLGPAGEDNTLKFAGERGNSALPVSQPSARLERQEATLAPDPMQLLLLHTHLCYLREEGSVGPEFIS